MKFFTKEIKIALVAILGIIMLFFGMNFLKGLNVFSSDNEYYIEFKDVTGLSASSPIYANGFPVGVVKSIDFDYSQKRPTRVLVGLSKSLRVPAESSAEIVSDMLGNVQVNLILTDNPTQSIQPGEVIKGDINNGAMGKLSAMVPTVERMLPKLDSIMSSLNMLLADPSIQRSVHNVESITASLTTSAQQLNTLMAQLNQNVPGMMNKANGILDNSSRLTANLASIDVESTIKKVDQTLTNVQDLTNKLNNNRGTLGLLMNDDKLYNKLTTTVQSADTLLNNLREHPKRYVHFSVFGKKDK